MILKESPFTTFSPGFSIEGVIGQGGATDCDSITGSYTRKIILGKDAFFPNLENPAVLPAFT